MPAPTDDAATQFTSLTEILRVARAWLRGGGRAAHDIGPDFWRNLQRELLAGRQWGDRAIVLAYAAATGAIVVAFTLLAEAAIHGFRQVESWGEHGRYLTLLWTPALAVALLWWTRRYVPGAGGSGIPQVVRALDDDLPPSQSACLASMRVSLHKIGLVGRAAGGSVDRPRGPHGPGRRRCHGQRQALAVASGQAMVLSLMACALLYSGVARLVTRPMYQELASLLSLPPPNEPRQDKP